MSTLSWQIAPSSLTLAQSEIHVWCASLIATPSQREIYQQWLSVDEQQRAARFHFEHHRHYYIVGRGVLRALLGYYLNQPPQTLQFVYGPQGKPSLPSPSPLQFNLSHSETLALYAFSRTRIIGVDIEYHKTNVAYTDIAQHFFAPSEQAALLKLPPAARQAAFYTCWTRKEAYLKAQGDGLTIPLDKFEVSLLPHDPPALLSTAHAPGEVTRWSVHALPHPRPDYTASLVVEGTGVVVQCYRYSNN